MTHFADGFEDGADRSDESEEEFFYDPTDPELLRTTSGCEIPPECPYHFIEGSVHPRIEDLAPYNNSPDAGSICLPASIALLNANPDAPLSRTAIYGLDLVLQSEERAKHTMVFGVTGAGKNVTVIDSLRYSAINDPTHIVVSFSLKASDYGPVSVMCESAGKRLVVINLDDASRSLAWNPLETLDNDVAFDHIRRFADAVKNQRANETEFWNQWIKTALMGAWQTGHKSFPAIYQFFSMPRKQQLEFLHRQDNDAARQLAEFISGGSQNADTVIASIIGALTPFLMEDVQRVMGVDELNLDSLFESPVCVHIEIREARLETQKTLHQLLARAIIDELIATAERAKKPLPATMFFDDMPSLGRLMSPQRLLTMRSRGIGVVAGVQSMASLELAYYDSARAIVENFKNKIVLPGGPAPEAAYFSTWTGEHFVAVKNEHGDETAYMSRPMLSGAAIRTPACSHPLLDKPATLFFGAVVFQAYLQKSYELPSVGRAIRRGRAKSGNEPLRKKPLLSIKEVNEKGYKSVVAMKAESFNTPRMRKVAERELYEQAIKQIGWSSESTAPVVARQWWIKEEKKRGIAKMTELANEIKMHEGTVWAYYQANRDCPYQDPAAVMLLMAYRVRCGKVQPPKKQMDFLELQEYGHSSCEDDEDDQQYMPLFTGDDEDELYINEFEDESVYLDEPEEEECVEEEDYRSEDSRESDFF